LRGRITIPCGTEPKPAEFGRQSRSLILCPLVLARSLLISYSSPFLPSFLYTMSRESVDSMDDAMSLLRLRATMQRRRSARRAAAASSSSAPPAPNAVMVHNYLGAAMEENEEKEMVIENKEEETKERHQGPRNKYVMTTDQVRRMITEMYVMERKTAPEIVNIINTNSGNKVTLHSVYNTMRCFRKQGRVDKKKRPGRRKLVEYTEEDKRIVESIQDAHHDWTYHRIRRYWHNELGHEKFLSTNFLCRTLREADFTTKQLEFEPPERNTPEAIAFRATYCALASRIPAASLVYIDETGFDLHCYRRRGRSRRGQKAIVVRESSQGERVSVVAAISPIHGLIAYQIELGHFNGDRFYDFIANNLLPRPLFHQQSMVLVMDNVRFHRNRELQQVITEDQPVQHRIQYIPPYSPHLNAIEYCFSNWKKYVNSQDKDQDTLRQVIERAINRTTADLCASYHSAVMQYMVHCAAGNPLRYMPPVPIRELGRAIAASV